MKFLIAEDNNFTRHLYEDQILKKNHEVVTVDDGWKCVETYKSEFEKLDSDIQKIPFDYVLLDYNMPVLKGHEVAEEILKINPNQKIVVTSAWNSKLLKESFKDIPDSIEILQKGFSIKDFIEKLEFEEAA